MRRVSTGRWLPRVEASDTKTTTQFRDAVASERGLPIAELVVVAVDSVTADTFTAIQAVLEKELAGADAEVWPIGDPDAALVYDAASVDAVTAARIRRLYGGGSGDQAKWEQLARQHAWAVEHEAWPDGRDVTAADTIAATTFLAADRILARSLERVRAEGHVMKRTKGWA